MARQTVMEAEADLGLFSKEPQGVQGTQVPRVLLVALVLQVLVRPVVLQEARVALAPTVTQEIQGQQEQAPQLVALVALALQGQMVTQEIQALLVQVQHLVVLEALVAQVLMATRVILALLVQALQLAVQEARVARGLTVTREIQALPEQAPHLAALVALAQQAPQVM